MLVVNLFGGPGTGKSTLAAGLFYHLKMNHTKVEIVNEYAKQLVYEQRQNILNDDQLYVFAKQHRGLIRVKDSVNVAILDSPLLLTNLYFSCHDRYSYDLFSTFVLDTFCRYNNLNIFLKRNKDIPYDPVGRNQSNISEAEVYDSKIEFYLLNNDIPYYTFVINPDKPILDDVLTLINTRI